MHSRWIKGAIAMLAAAISFGLAGCDDDSPVGPARARGGYADGDGQKVYFSFRDPKYDDRGPGFYTYPLLVERPPGRRTPQVVDGVVEDLGNTQVNLDTRTGFFDISNFEVKDDGPFVVFEITTARPIPRFREDQSSEAKGWFLQLMDIYIDKDKKPGSGRTRALPGRNIEFAPESGWEQCVLVTPQVSFDVRRLIEQITWDLDFVRHKRQIYIPDRVFIEGYTFRVFVPKNEIGEPQPHWGYQVAMMLFNPTNLEYGHFQQGEVKRFAGNNLFGGADDYQGHPNVIDVLAPTPEKQYEWLSDFISSPNINDNRLAILPMIYADGAKTGQAIAGAGTRTRNARLAGAPKVRPANTDDLLARGGIGEQKRQAQTERRAVVQPRQREASRDEMAARLRAGGLSEDPQLAEALEPRPTRRQAAQRVTRSAPVAQRRPAPPRAYPADDGGELLAAPRPAPRQVARSAPADIDESGDMFSNTGDGD